MARVGLARCLDVPSVRANDLREAKFPEELPTRLIRMLT